jgi:hypothetical protein
MTVEGTVVGGHVRLDRPASLPEGTRVRLVTEDDDWAVPPPPEPDETREEFLASIRESVAAAKVGDYGMTVEEAFAKLRAEAAGQSS